jgi:methyl-accepting chemotaxis protein
LTEALKATADDFNREVAQVNLGLTALARDASALLGLRDLVYGGDKAQVGGSLRHLEQRIGDAVRLVTEIETADGLTRQTSHRVAETARVLSSRLGAVQSIKTDVLFMALNTSLKSSRLGEAGRPLAAIAVELRSQAGQLERIANASAGILRALTAAATALAAEGAEGMGEGAGVALLAATERIHEAGASTERDIASLAAQGEAVLALLTQSTERLDLQTDIGAALAQVLRDLPGGAAEAELCTEDVLAPLTDILARLRATYTMAQERALHDALMSEWGLDVAPPPPAAEAASGDALEDVLF